METEKNSEPEEDNQESSMSDKDTGIDIKSRIDLTDIIDASLQGQDLTSGLNAEVDLDDSVDKLENLIDQSEKLHNALVDKINDSSLLNGHEKECIKDNEQNNSVEDEESTETEDQHELLIEESDFKEENGTSPHNRETIDCTTVQDRKMGNNLDGKDKPETSEDSVEKLSQEPENNTVKNEHPKVNDHIQSQNNNEKELKDLEKLVLENVDLLDSNQADTVDGNEMETTENTEMRITEVKVEGDTDVNQSAEVSGDTENTESQENENLETKDLELQETVSENETDSALDGNEAEGRENKEENISVTVMTQSLETAENIIVNDEHGRIEEMTEKEITDKERIQNFIKEVINDLHGIVAETEECDAMIDAICEEESARNELLTESDVMVGSVSSDAVPESGDYSDVMETVNVIGIIKHAENSELTYLNKDEQMCALVEEETSKLAECSESIVNEADLTLQIEEITNEDTKTEHISNDVSEISNQTTETGNEMPENNQMTSEICNENTEPEKETAEITTEKSDALKELSDHQLENNIHTMDSFKDGLREQDLDGQEAISAKIKDKNDFKLMEEKLKMTQAALQASQRSLQEESSKHNRDVMTLKLQLYRSQTDLKKQKAKSEKQLTEIMSHLIMLESRLRQEQLRLKRESRDKNKIIENQNKEIMKLKDQNEQLLNAIKEICAKGGMNGYMRENRRKNGSQLEGFESNLKGSKDKKGHATGKLGTMKDKFMAKNRSSLELNSFSLEKYLIKDQRLCSSQEDLHRLVDDRRRSIPTIAERVTKNPKDTSPKNRPASDTSEYKNGSQKKHGRYSQNFFNDGWSPKYEMNKSASESSHLSDSTNSSSGVYSLSDHDLSMQNDSVTNGHHGDYEHMGDDDDDDRIFSFSSTHINTVIAEEEALGPTMTHSGQMMSMGSMPLLVNLKEETIGPGKNRPHSLSSVDLASIQQQARNFAQFERSTSPQSLSPEKHTPPSSPSYHSKNELTPFQTFKTMFRRKGSSKNKGHKKRSVSLSQTTNTEYSEALKKHFQKYDMS